MAIDISSSFRQLLTQSTEVTEAVGSRIFSDMIPQSADEPCIVYWVITETVLR